MSEQESVGSAPSAASAAQSAGGGETVAQSFGSAEPEPTAVQTLGSADPGPLPVQTFGSADPEPPAVQTFGSADPEPKVVQSLRSAEPAARPAQPAQVLGTAPDGEPPRKRRRALTAAIFVVIVLVLLGAAGYLAYVRLFADPTRNAAAGDCLTNLPQVDPGQDREATGARVVACTDSSATFRVEGRLDNQSADQAKSGNVCDAYPDATFIYRAVPDNGTGYVLCLTMLNQ